MTYVCSDTNIWLDFHLAGKLDIPFRLEWTFLMYKESIENELINPPDLPERLKSLGLQETDITFEELSLADSVVNNHKKLSVHDAVAYAIAKTRGIALVTGDMRLRKLAEKNDVFVIGSIGLVDKAMKEKAITPREALSCFLALQTANGHGIRLPAEELEKRIIQLESFCTSE